MKTLFLTLSLFVIFAAQAQDFTFMSSANKADVTTANEIAQNIASNASNKYRLYKSIENAKMSNYRVIYAPANMTDQQIADQFNYEHCLVVDYTIYYAGKDADHPGTKTYKLREVKADYADVLANWQKFFVPTATADTMDFKSHSLKDYDKKLDFRIQKSATGKEWILYNRS